MLCTFSRFSIRPQRLCVGTLKLDFRGKLSSLPRVQWKASHLGLATQLAELSGRQGAIFPNNANLTSIRFPLLRHVRNI